MFFIIVFSFFLLCFSLSHILSGNFLGTIVTGCDRVVVKGEVFSDFTIQQTITEIVIRRSVSPCSTVVQQLLVVLSVKTRSLSDQLCLSLVSVVYEQQLNLLNALWMCETICRLKSICRNCWHVCENRVNLIGNKCFNIFTLSGAVWVQI